MLEIRILGPVELRRDGVSVDLSRRHQRGILGVLALTPNRAVSVDYLVEVLWGAKPPRSYRANLQTRVSEVRMAVSSAGGDWARTDVRASGAGYVLDIAPESVDAHEFLTVARSWRDVVPAAEARDALRDALGLWRGDLFGGEIDLGAVASLTHELDGARTTAAEDLFSLELALGRHREIIDEIQRALNEHPERERLLGQLMIALYRAGRGGDALRGYDAWRRRLREQLGVDPGAELRRLHMAIIRDDPDAVGEQVNSALPAVPAASSPATIFPAMGFPAMGSGVTAVPRTLPPPISDLTGRDDDVAFLLDRLGGDDSVRTVSITGSGGVGKTALALYVAHEMREHFADGQLFASLRGHDRSAPVAPFDVLHRFLTALGVDGTSIPATLDERIDLYRSLLAPRRILVVLDNAADDEQISALLPSGAGAKALVTSRAWVGESVGATTIRLGVLDGSTAGELLGRIIGPDRAESEAEAVATVARHCGYLPLALRVIGAKLANRPHWPIDKVADMLADERGRLDHFSRGSLDVRASIQLSYAGLSEIAQRLLRLLGDIDLPEISVWLCSALLDDTCEAAESTLEALAEAHFLDIAGTDLAGHFRYRMHDLIRLYAQERAGEGPPATLTAARDRVQRAAIFILLAQQRRINGDDFQTVRVTVSPWPVDESLTRRLIENPSAWTKLERFTIAALVRRALAEGEVEAAWQLVCAASVMIQMLRYFDDHVALLTPTLAAAITAGDVRGQATMVFWMAYTRISKDDYRGAQELFETASRLFRLVGDQHATATADSAIAMTSRVLGDPDRALVLHRAAADVLCELGDRRGEAYALRSIGQVYLNAGDYDLASAHLGRALSIMQTIGSPSGTAPALYWHGVLNLRRNRTDDAAREFEEALAICHDIGDGPGHLFCLRGLAAVHLQRGDVRLAHEILATALQLAQRPTVSRAEILIRKEIAALPSLPPVAALLN